MSALLLAGVRVPSNLDKHPELVSDIVREVSEGISEKWGKIEYFLEHMRRESDKFLGYVIMHLKGFMERWITSHRYDCCEIVEGARHLLVEVLEALHNHYFPQKT